MKTKKDILKIAIALGLAGTALFFSTRISKCPSCKFQQQTNNQGKIMSTENNNTENFEAAKARAKAENKPIIAVFSGSDWCSWCIRLENEVLKQPAFVDWAKENAVVFSADFPRRKPQAPETAKQNEALSDAYDIQSFPTVLILDANGNEKGRTGYREGGAAAYVDYLKSIIK